MKRGTQQVRPEAGTPGGREASIRSRADDRRYDSVETISRPEGRSDIRADVQRRCLCLLLADLNNPSGCGTLSEP
jgi:hypothetical protein